MTTIQKPTFKVIGTRPIRHDGTDKVTGRATYGADFHLPGLLYGKVLRSPHAHALIKEIDVSKALAHPGVKVLVTSEDLPAIEDRVPDLGETAVSLRYLSKNILAYDKGLYKGHPVAGVAADSPNIAEEALALVDVEYEVLPSVLKAPDAMKRYAPLLHDDLFTDEMGRKATMPSNIAKHIQFKLGDVEEGFNKAHLVIEREFNTVTVHQGYIETHNAIARWEPDGRLTIWCSTQGAFTVRDQIARILDMPVSKVKVVPMEIGGGFGGKIPIYLEPVAALLSMKTGQPVKMVMRREEVFEGTGPTAGSYIRCKIGATREGRIVAAQAFMAYEAGAFPGSPINPGMICIFASYDIENVLIDGYDVVDNKPKTAAYRAPGATNASFASETIVDELAGKLGFDPLEFRLKNAAKQGTRRGDGVVNPRIGYEETVLAAMEHDHYKTPLVGPNRGRGVASGYWMNAGLHSSCTISVNPDGTVSLVEGSTDIGGTRVSIAMQAAEVLGLPAEDVHPQVENTDSIGYTTHTGGSRVTFATGWAAYEAAQDLKRKLIERAALIWDISPEQVAYLDAVLWFKEDPELRMTFKELAEMLNDTGGPIGGAANVSPRGVGGAYATHIVDVEVDTETGKVDILRYTAVQDAGKAIHPSYVEGQMQGGVAQGIGWALNEEYFYTPQGRMANSSFLDYRMPIALDLPMIETIIVEVPNPGHPFGVRGVGEVPIVPPAAALANAIYGAVGVRLTHLPMNPGRILDALWEKDGKQ